MLSGRTGPAAALRPRVADETAEDTVALSWHDVGLGKGLLDDPDMATGGK